MKKHYIFAMPVMTPGKLEPNKTKNCSEPPKKALDYIGMRTSFPILTLMKNTLSEDEEFKMTIIETVDHRCTRVNHKIFMEELEAVIYGYDLYTDVYDEFYKNYRISELERKIYKPNRKPSPKDVEKLETLKTEGITQKMLQTFLAVLRKTDEKYGELSPEEIEGKLKELNEKGELTDEEKEDRNGLIYFIEFSKYYPGRIEELKAGKKPLIRFNKDENMNIIEKTKAETEGAQTKLMIKILNKMKEESETYLYADLSFGSKPVPIVMNTVMKYMYNRGRAVIPKAMVYAYNEYDGKGEDCLYDVTYLLYATSTLEQLENMDLDEPVDSLEEIIND